MVENIEVGPRTSYQQGRISGSRIFTIKHCHSVSDPAITEIIEVVDNVFEARICFALRYTSEISVFIVY